MADLKISWGDLNFGSAQEDGFRIYRGLSPIDPDALPTPIATLAPDVKEFTDPGVAGAGYYYAVSCFKGGASRIALSLRAREGATNPIFVPRLGTPVSNRAELETVTGTGFFYMTNDIDLGGADWVPLNFYGHFDMGGFTISNMTVTPTSSGGSHAGFFRTAQYSTICRGRFLNCSVSNGSAANYGGLVAGLFDDAFAYDLILQDCIVYTAGDRAGSVFGLARRSALRRVLDLNTAKSGGTLRSGAMIGVALTSPNHTRTTSNNFYQSGLGWPGTYGTAKSLAQLKAAATYPESDFNPNVYNIVDGQFPTFKTLEFTEIIDRAGLETHLAQPGTNRGLYRLRANIDMSGADFVNSADFAGILDGDGFQISNLTRESISGNAGGLFRRIIDFGVVENLSLHATVGQTSTDDANYQGAIAGDSYGAIIVNCKTSGRVYGTDRIGGFVGFCRGAIFHKCLAACFVGNGTRVGAFYGFPWDEGGEIDYPWGNYTVNATDYSGNTIAYYNHPNAPTTARAWSDPTATTAVNYTDIRWSPDLWDLVDGTLPEFAKV